MESTAQSGWDAFQAIVDAARKHNLPVPTSITDRRVYAGHWRDVVAWAKALGGELHFIAADLAPGTVQAGAYLPQLGLGKFFDVIGAAECTSCADAQEHEMCVKQARAEAASLLGELVQA